MKQFLSLLAIVMVAAACNSTKYMRASDPEEFVARVISEDSAKIYRANYERDPKIRKRFRQGMMIPMEALNAIVGEGKVTNLQIYYGKAEFKSPVFIIYGADSQLRYKSQSPAAPAARTIYLVYYPCPPHCL